MTKTPRCILRRAAVLFTLFPLTFAGAAASQEQGDEPQSVLRPPENEKTIEAGRRSYKRSCIYCHGPEGRGDGPVVFFLSRKVAPRPRDFTLKRFKYRSTESGELPTDDDLFRLLTNGRSGLMPGYSALSREERWHLVYYVKSLVPEFLRPDAQPQPIEISAPLPPTPRSLAQGETLYEKLQCSKCHGYEGRGDGPSAKTLTTAQGLRIPSTDLHRPSSFGNGSLPQDVYRTLMTSLKGVPMPSYAAAMSEEDAWHLANYVLSLGGERR